MLHTHSHFKKGTLSFGQCWSGLHEVPHMWASSSVKDQQILEYLLAWQAPTWVLRDPVTRGVAEQVAMG